MADGLYIFRSHMKNFSILKYLDMELEEQFISMISLFIFILVQEHDMSNHNNNIPFVFIKMFTHHFSKNNGCEGLIVCILVHVTGRLQQ